MTILVGIDIGGTKCAVSIGTVEENSIKIHSKERFSTTSSHETTLKRIEDTLEQLMRRLEISNIDAIGISCGGPLDSERGLILSPPNLPNWESINVVSLFKNKYHVPVGLQNDANACALAEWKWGAGKGCRNMIFLTFGTGMGAGLIINGELYTGTNDMAGEVGHIRLENEGPMGFGKEGSFEGFCSGGGIEKLARKEVAKWLLEGQSTLICHSIEQSDQITTKKVGEAAQKQDPLALNIFKQVGEKLGKGLAILVDILNPERIVIGSIYLRQQDILEPIVMSILKNESLPTALSVCEIVPAGLGEEVGDYASLSVAWNILNKVTKNQD
ncbi:ROK family protein [Bacillus timonensis]|uniref:ROK family protein n=1 Tax=Bacillus timonensis TaxID=1033734 RepID=UPI0002892EBB|nr:ROK family protein [Bacillus timonensis]